MSHWKDEDSGDDWEDAPHAGGEFPADDEVSCPHCSAAVHYESERCPHCGWYLSAEDEPSTAAQPQWITITAVLLLIALLLGAFGGMLLW